MPKEDAWNWLEYIHETAKDMAIHTGSSYQEVAATLLKTSGTLSGAWEDGYGAGRDDEAKALDMKDRTKNPYWKGS